MTRTMAWLVLAVASLASGAGRESNRQRESREPIMAEHPASETGARRGPATPPPIRELNDRAASLIAGRRHADAERVLDEIAALLAARPPAVPVAADLGPAQDELYYRINRAELLWAQMRFGEEEVMPHLRRAYDLERGITSLVSDLTGLGRLQEAERAFDEASADARVFAARLAHDRAAAERFLVAGLRVFSAPGTRHALVAGRPLVERVERLDPDPEHVELAFGLASYHGRLRERVPTLHWLSRAIERGLPRDRARQDPDLAWLSGDPQWQAIVEPREAIRPSPPDTWDVRSSPEGAAVWIDGADTGLRTPARLPARPGDHVLTVKLDGHEDQVVSFTQKPGTDQGWGLRLRSHAEARAVAQQKEDSANPPDAAKRAKTRAFLGADERWRSARVLLRVPPSLRLGLEIEIGGDGDVRVRSERRGDRTWEEVRAAIAPAEARAVLQAFVDEAFTEMFFAPHGTRTLLPDTPVVTLVLRSPRRWHAAHGEECARSTAHGEHRRFDALYDLVLAVASRALDAPTRARFGLR